MRRTKWDVWEGKREESGQELRSAQKLKYLYLGKCTREVGGSEGTGPLSQGRQGCLAGRSGLNGRSHSVSGAIRV